MFAPGCLSGISGPIQKKSSVSDDSSSDMMELDDSALVAESQLEQNLSRLREEERLLIEKQEAGAMDDIAALEHQDALRHNQLQQQEVQKQQKAQALRAARQQALALEEASGARPREPRDQCELREGPRRRAACTVRVNNLHAASAAEAIETDV